MINGWRFLSFRNTLAEPRWGPTPSPGDAGHLSERLPATASERGVAHGVAAVAVVAERRAYSPVRARRAREFVEPA